MNFIVSNSAVYQSMSTNIYSRYKKYLVQSVTLSIFGTEGTCNFYFVFISYLFAEAHKEVVGLHVAMDKVLAMDELYPANLKLKETF